MAFNIGDRFPPTPYPYRLLEPCSYQSEETHKPKVNKAPFLSTSKRKTEPGNRVWTQKIYDTAQQQKIPNCTSLKSKIPRFPYEALSNEDIEAMLCKCGISDICECSDTSKQEPEVNCDAKQNRRIFKGPTPKPKTEGLSAPSRRDHGFKEMPDGCYKRIFIVEKDFGPPFYNSEVTESTAFYRGWKWSQWRSQRATKIPEKSPGPADYNIVKQPNDNEICAEKVREQKRKYSKQPRGFEIIQHKNLQKYRFEPATCSPRYSKDLEIKIPRPKAERFKDDFNQLGPGPAAHSIKRDFDVPGPPPVLCLARLPAPSFFGNNAKRFKVHKEQGPSPASYSPNKKICRVLNCNPPPFGSSAQRFKKVIGQNEQYEEYQNDDIDHEIQICSLPTWEFRSKTIRMKPLKKKPYEQSPADVPLNSFYAKRSSTLQHIAPFHSSEGRFQPWYNWLSVYGRLKTPGPGYYNLEKYKCLPAVCYRSMCRTERFPASRYQGPAPNEYNVGGGVDTILATHNKILRDVMGNKHKHVWKSLEEDKTLSYLEQESLILEKAIASLEVDPDGSSLNVVQQPSKIEKLQDNIVSIRDASTNNTKPKLLRYFLYRHPVDPGF